MISEIVDLTGRTTGQVFIYTILANGEKVLKHHLKNALTADAPRIMARSLGGDAAMNIQTISIRGAGITLAISEVSSTYPNINEVLFTAVFEAESFDGDYDTLWLNATGFTFSEITGLTLNKDPDEKIAIAWLLTIT
jgi:hypothetical protein